LSGRRVDEVRVCGIRTKVIEKAWLINGLENEKCRASEAVYDVHNSGATTHVMDTPP
jgi:hypothetical protein